MLIQEKLQWTSDNGMNTGEKQGWRAQQRETLHAKSRIHAISI